jgi:hypothetical protein
MPTKQQTRNVPPACWSDDDRAVFVVDALAGDEDAQWLFVLGLDQRIADTALYELPPSHVASYLDVWVESLQLQSA